MTDDKSTFQEVQDLLAERLRAGLRTTAAWLQEEVLARRKNVSGDDADWYIAMARERLASLGNKALRSIKAGPRTSPQMRFAGFEVLQLGYSFQRDGEMVAIPTAEMTVDDWAEKVVEHEAMIRGCTAHVREIRKFTKLHGMDLDSALLRRKGAAA